MGHKVTEPQSQSYPQSHRATIAVGCHKVTRFYCYSKHPDSPTFSYYRFIEITSIVKFTMLE